MSTPNRIGVGVVGLGFMGRTHLAAYRAAARDGLANRIVAVHDASLERLDDVREAVGNLETGAAAELGLDAATTRHTSAAALFADDDVQLVSICTPTDTHVELAIAALDAGKHVLLEKPVALRTSEAERLAAAAATASTLCMPAMCMRFWPGWDWLRAAVRDQRYGAVKSAVFRRLGGRPGWSTDFYHDSERTGGALFDLHVHDADFVRWCFGEPAAVVSTGTLDHVTTLYRYSDGPAHVVAEGGWDHTPGFPFRMQYVVVFEEATAEFAFDGSACLRIAHGGEARDLALADGNGYDGEIRHLLRAIHAGRTELEASVQEAVGLTAMLAAEGESLRAGETVTLD